MTRTVLRRAAPVPGGRPLPAGRMPPSASRVDPLHREITICYAYMCPYAYACHERSERPAQVFKRRCMRYMPPGARVEPSLSDMALDLLARWRQQRKPLAEGTLALLDRFRPNGPLRASP